MELRDQINKAINPLKKIREPILLNAVHPKYSETKDLFTTTPMPIQVAQISEKTIHIKECRDCSNQCICKYTDEYTNQVSNIMELIYSFKAPMEVSIHCPYSPEMTNRGF